MHRYNLSKAGWSWGCASTLDSNARTIWIADAHRDGKRFVVRADEKLTAFVELKSAIGASEALSRGNGTTKVLLTSFGVGQDSIILN